MNECGILGIKKTLDLTDWQSDINPVMSRRIPKLRSLDSVFKQPLVDKFSTYTV
jgi:hypothetical protein